MKLRRLTLAELGADYLPIYQDNMVPLSFQPYTMGMERRLGEIRQQHPDWSFFQYLTEVLKLMVGFGPDWDDLGPKEKLMRINQLYFPNAVYAYVQLRRNSLGPKGVIPVVCPTCGHKWNYEFDLDDTPVTVVDGPINGPEDISWEVELEDGFKWGDTTIKTLTLTVPRWQAVAGIRRSSNPVTLQLELLRTYIVSPPRHGTPTMQVLEGITRRDMLIIGKSLDDHAVGIDFSINTACPLDKTPIDVTIDWSMDTFFGTSYLSTRKKT